MLTLIVSSYSNGPTPSPYTMEHSASPGPLPTRDYLKSQEEVLYMQVFVEEIGIWMDSMDAHKHFSRLLPFHALNEPMLLPYGRLSKHGHGVPRFLSSCNPQDARERAGPTANAAAL